MSRPSWTCQPPLRTQPKVPLVHSFPAVPTKKFSSAPFLSSVWLAEGKLKGASAAEGKAEQEVNVQKIQIPNPKFPVLRLPKFSGARSSGGLFRLRRDTTMLGGG